MEETTTALFSSSSVKDGSSGMGIFTNKGTLHLIECVRMRPKLWHRQFLRKRVSSCVAEWDDIQQHEFPGYNVSQLKVRWKTMRDCFRRELRRLESGEIARSRWPLYEHMKFLDGHFRLKGNARHKVPPGTVFARRHVPSTPSKESIKTDIKTDSAENVPSTAPGTEASDSCEAESGRLIIVEADNAPDSNSEVTYSNKFRKRLRPDPIVESGYEGWHAHGHDTTNSQFLMSLVPFLNMLPIERNLQVRFKVLQLIVNAAQSLNGADWQ